MPDQPPSPPPDEPRDRPSGPAPYGPNTAAVRRFLQRFAALRPAEWDQAARAYERAQAGRAYAAADRALAQAVTRAGREAERDAVVGPLVQIVRDQAERAAPPRPTPGGDADALALLPPVAEAALGALLALVMRDALADSAFEALYAPFAELVPPASLGGG